MRCVSTHAYHDDLFYSTGSVGTPFRINVHAPDFPRLRLVTNREDGRVIFHDARVDRRLSNAQGVLQHTTEFTGVQAHPVMEHIFATSDSHGQVCLRDTRMAFGPLSARSNEGIVQTVRLSLCRARLLSMTSLAYSTSLNCPRGLWGT